MEFIESNLSIKLRNIPKINVLEIIELAHNRPDTLNWSKSGELNWSEIDGRKYNIRSIRYLQVE